MASLLGGIHFGGLQSVIAVVDTSFSGGRVSA